MMMETGSIMRWYLAAQIEYGVDYLNNGDLEHSCPMQGRCWADSTSWTLRIEMSNIPHALPSHQCLGL